MAGTKAQWATTIEQVREGHEEAKSAFYHQHDQYLGQVFWAFARRHPAGQQLLLEEMEETVAEAVVDTIALGLSKIQDYDRDRAEVRTWLVALGRPRLYRALQRTVRRRQHERSLTLEANIVANPAMGPEQEVLQKEWQERIFETLRSLKPRHAKVILGVDYLGVPLRQIATSMGLPSEEAASSLVRRARQAFKRKWGGGQ